MHNLLNKFYNSAIKSIRKIGFDIIFQVYLIFSIEFQISFPKAYNVGLNTVKIYKIITLNLICLNSKTLLKHIYFTRIEVVYNFDNAEQFILRNPSNSYLNSLWKYQILKYK